MKIEFKNYSCYSCNSKKYSETVYARQAFDELFKIYKCENCSCEYINKVPANKETYEFIYDYGGRDSKVNLNSIFTKLRLYKTKSYLKKHCNSYLNETKKVLDYGSGDGYLSYSFKLINPSSEVHATDYLFNNTIFYKEIKFIQLDDVLNSNEQYDLIILRHVLEHIEYPFKVIEKLIEKLDDNGVILVEVPNHNPETNILLKWFKKDYSQIGFPWHLNHFKQSDFIDNIDKNRLEFSKNSIPVLGQSLLMKLFKEKIFFDNTGILALIFYPIQIVIDYFSGSFSALVVKIYKK